MSEILDFVLSRAEQGLHILPVGAYVDPADEVGYKASKEPLGGQGFDHATTDPGVLRRWWTQWPDARPAAALAPSGLLAVDHDTYKPGHLELVDGLPETLEARTPRGGRHLFFRLPPDGKIPKGTSKGGVDVKANGYVILPAPGSGYTCANWAQEIAVWPGHLKAYKDKPKEEDTPALGSVAASPVTLPAPVVAMLLEEPNGDRSGQHYRFIGALLEAGVNDATIVALARRHAPTRGKYGDRLEEEVGRAIGNYRSEHPEVGDATPTPAWQDRFDCPAGPDEAAYYGLPGEVVRCLAPHIEAGSPAVLAQFLTGFGSAVGPNPYFPVGGDRHKPNLYAAVVGETGKGRKGSGLSAALAPVVNADGGWSSDCRVFGVSTGEGIINRLRDPVINGKGEVVDEGARDKRLLAIETEFARVLKVATRDGNTLSMVLRQGWDGQTLETVTKTNAQRASGPHLSFIGHTTRADLRRYLDDTDVLNGFANRYLWLASRRERILPNGGEIPVELMNHLTLQTQRALQAARIVGRMSRDPAAQKLWEDIYPQLTEGRAGAFGAVTGRGDAQVLRLSIAYALTDGSAVINEAHLRAALALWEYCEATCLWVFGWSTGNRQADLILAELRAIYPRTLGREDIRQQLLSRNHPVDEPLHILEEQGFAQWTTERTGDVDGQHNSGRPTRHPPLLELGRFPVPPNLSVRVGKGKNRYTRKTRKILAYP